MPIYEYRAVGESCEYCRNGFEIMQRMDDKHLSQCPKCRRVIGRIPSRFRACVIETADEVAETEGRLHDFEKEGMWSHAAELADKAGLEDRAREDYKKAGYEM